MTEFYVAAPCEALELDNFLNELENLGLNYFLKKVFALMVMTVTLSMEVQTQLYKKKYQYFNR
jgi:hypothetical protein